MRKRSATVLALLFCAVPCRAIYSLSSDQSVRLENLFDVNAHAPPQTCRAGGKTFVVLSTDLTYYLHAADGGSATRGLAPSWSCSLFSWPSAAVSCVDPGGLSATEPAVFVVDANATVHLSSGFSAPSRRLPGCASPDHVLVSSVDWGNNSVWYPNLNGVFMLYACGGNSTSLAYYSLYDAGHSPLNPMTTVTSASGTPSALDSAAFGSGGICAVAFSVDDRIYFAAGRPEITGANFVYGMVWGAPSVCAADGAVTSVAIADVDAVAYVVVSATGNFSSAFVANATSNETQLLYSGASGEGVGYWEVLAGNLERPNSDLTRDILLHAGAALLRFEYAPGQGWVQTHTLELALGAGQLSLALSRSYFASYPYMSLVAEAREASYTTLKYYYGHEITCTDYKGMSDQCALHRCRYCDDVGICTEGECPVCEAITDELNCTASLCLWCSEVMQCSNPLTPCQLCRNQATCAPPCVYCNSTQSCFSNYAICTYCPEYTESLDMCRSSDSCAVCDVTQECLSVQDSCFDCHQYPIWEYCRLDARCGWCSYWQRCEGIHSGPFNLATSSICLCSDAQTEANCSASSSCYWDELESQCLPARCIRGKPGPFDFIATIFKTEVSSNGTRVTLSGELITGGFGYANRLFVASSSSRGPWIATTDGKSGYICMNIFASPAATITKMVWDSGYNLYYVVGGGRDLPLKTDGVPADVGFSSAVKTEECYIAAFDTTDCSMRWAIPWGSEADGEIFTDMLITDDYIAISGIVGANFPVNGVCAPQQTMGLSGLVLIYDRAWNLQSCQFCGTQMNHMSILDGRLAALGVGQYSDRAKLLRYFSDSSTWLCDDIPINGDVQESKAVALVQDSTNGYLVAMVPSIATAAGSVSRLVVVDFYEVNPVVLLEADLLSSDPTHALVVTGVQAVFASFLALDVGGYVHNDTTSYAILGSASLAYAGAPNASVPTSMELKRYLYQVWAPQEGGFSKFTSIGNFLNFILLGGSTTEDNFLSTSYDSHSPDHNPNPVGILMARQDHDLACLPPLPVPPQWATVKMVLPASGIDAGVNLAAWPLFNFSWDAAYFAFANSYYNLRVGADPALRVQRDATWILAQLPFAFDETVVPWSIEPHTPYAAASANSTVTYRVVPKKMPADLIALAASPSGNMTTAVTDASGAALAFAFTNATLVIDTAGSVANVAMSTSSFVFNLTNDDWLVFTTSSYVYSAQKNGFWRAGYPKIRLTSYDGYVEWSASSAACSQRQVGDWQTFGVPLSSGVNDTPCQWQKAASPPQRQPDMRGVFAVSMSFWSAYGNIIVLKIANLTTAPSYAVHYAPSESSDFAKKGAGGATLGLLGLVGAIPIVAAALLAIYLYRRKNDQKVTTMLQFDSVTSSAPEFDPGDAVLIKNLAEFPLLIPKHALYFGCRSKTAPIDTVITDTFVIGNGTGKGASGGMTEGAEAAPPSASEPPSDRGKWSTGTSNKSGDATGSTHSSTPKASSSACGSGKASKRASASSSSSKDETQEEEEEESASQSRAAMPPAKYSWKIFATSRPTYDLRFEPDSGCLSAGARVEVTAELRAKCTTALNLKIPIAICKGSKFDAPEMYIHFTIKLDTVMSSKIDPNELTLCQPAIGGGTYGTVYRGQWRGQEVAIKLLKNQQMQADEMDQFQNEVDIMGKLKSPYIINFLGACFIPGRLAILTELCPLGNLSAVIQSKELSSLLKIKVLLDCAKGMNVIHQASAIHRDLKPDNLLMISLDARAPVCCKISDMGTARTINRAQATQYYTKGMGTPVYMAPEILENSKYSSAADVYSFALVAYYVMTHTEPYSEKCETESESGSGAFATSWKIADFVRSGKRLTIPDSVPAFAADMIGHCWEQEPHDRPSFAEIATTLGEAYQSQPDAERHHRRHRDHDRAAEEKKKEEADALDT